MSEARMPDHLLPTALVTGGAIRVGAILARTLAGLGFAVAIHHHGSAEAGKALAREIAAKGGKAVTLAANLADPEAVPGLIPAAAEALGRPIGLLVNSAASFTPDRLATLAPEALRRQLAINLEAPLLLAQAYVQALPKDRPGLIVNLGDQRSQNPTASYLGYSISKAGLAMASAVLARELAPRIRVNTLALGLVMPPPGLDAARFAALVQAAPLQRSTSEAEIAQALTLIVRSPSMTGATLTLDSGMSMGWAWPGG